MDNHLSDTQIANRVAETGRFGVHQLSAPPASVELFPHAAMTHNTEFSGPLKDIPVVGELSGIDLDDRHNWHVTTDAEAQAYEAYCIEQDADDLPDEPFHSTLPVHIPTPPTPTVRRVFLTHKTMFSGPLEDVPVIAESTVIDEDDRDNWRVATTAEYDAYEAYWATQDD